MKTLLVAILVVVSAVSLLLMPLAVYTQPVTTVAAPSSGQSASAPPPVSQPLIREGDFAVKLVSALNLGTANSGADAETILTSAEIVPKNGWISDYPMTPVVVGQLQESIEAAASAGKLPMNSNEAIKAFQALVADEGLPVEVASGTSPGEAATNYGEYSNPTVINNYYYDEGPPVVTYYAPPPDYLYLYSWVSYPFWWSGFWFPGFYCLNDFDVVLFVHHERELCTNHFFNRATGRFFRIDPRNLGIERAFHGRRELALSHWREHAGAIYRQNLGRFQARNGAYFRGNAERRLAPFSRTERMGQSQAMHHPIARNRARSFQAPTNHHMIASGRGFQGSKRSFGGFHSPSIAGQARGFHGGFAHGFNGGFSHPMTNPGLRGSGGPARSFGGFHSPSIAGQAQRFHGSFAHGFNGGFSHPMTNPGLRGFGGPARSFGGFHSPSLAGRAGGFHGGGFARGFGGGFHGGIGHGRG